MSAMLPTALFGDGLENLSRGAQARLGGLLHIAGSKIAPGLRQEEAAGIAVLLHGHGVPDRKFSTPEPAAAPLFIPARARESSTIR